MITSSYYSFYTIKPSKHWSIKDEPKNKTYNHERGSEKKSLLFHVQHDDYFSTLATVLGFFKESIHDNNVSPEMKELHYRIITTAISELIFLSKHYNITPKDKKY